MKKILLSLFSLCVSYTAFTQCTVFATPQNPNFNCNDSAIIDLVGFSEVFVADTFSAGGPTSLTWTSTAGAIYGNPYLPSIQGGAYFWMGPSATVPTALTSDPFDLTGISSGLLCFEFVYANGNDGMHPPPNQGFVIPEQPDEYDEGIGVRFNVGGGWQDIVYFAPNGDSLVSNPAVDNPSLNFNVPGPYEVWTEVCIDIPTNAIGQPNVQFQWIQESNSGACCDHWGLDNVFIVGADLGYQLYSVNDNNLLIGNSPNSYAATPLSDSTFIFLYTNGVDSCYDSVDLFLNPTDAGPDVTASCSTLGIPIEVSGVSPWSNVTWTPPLGLSDPNIINPIANPTNDQLYTVNTDCGTDDIFVNVVPIFDINVTYTEDSICEGESSTLSVTTNQPGGYTYQWTPALSASTPNNATTDVSPTTDERYYVEVVSDSGCIRTDSIIIFVGNVPRTINIDGELRVCRGDSTLVSLMPIQPTLFDNFDLGVNLNHWMLIENGTSNTDCGSVTGNALHFNGIGSRQAQTIPVDASLGGTVSFSFIYGSSFNPGSPCSDVFFFNTVDLEYSIDNGMTWVNINTFDAFDHDIWEMQTFDVPVAAQTTTTIFRLNQPLHGGQDDDNWAIDNFLLELNCVGQGCTTYSYDWSPNMNISNTNISNPYFYPNTTSTYAVTISPDGFNCDAVLDSITIEVDELPFTLIPEDTFLCEVGPVFLEVELSNTTCTGEYRVESVPIDYLTSTTATTVSLGDDQLSNTIPLPFDLEFFCQDYQSFRISSNGYITFDGSNNNSGCCSGQNIPENAQPNGVIALKWEDLNPNLGGTITHFVDGVSPNRIQVIEFDTIRIFGSTQTISGQIQIYETTNIIEIHCLDCQEDFFPNISTLGIENIDGSQGYSPDGFNAVSWNATNTSWRFTPSHSSANFAFNWTPSESLNDDQILNPLARPLESTNYVFNVLNENNCLFQDSIPVNLYESNTTLTSNVEQCFGDSIQLQATGALEYTWTSSAGMNTTLNDTSISNPVSGTLSDIWYYVTYNTLGCIEEDSVRIDILNAEILSVNNNQNPVNFCEGGQQELFVDALEEYDYTWDGPETGTGNSITVSTPGLYTVEYFDGVCDNTRFVNLVEQPNPIIDFSPFDQSLCCEDDSLRIDFNTMVSNIPSTEIDEIYWNGEEVLATSNSYTYYSADDNFTQLDEVLVRSIFGCESNTSLSIETNCLNPSISGPDTIFLDDVTQIDLNHQDTQADNITYAWSTTDDPSSILNNSVQNPMFNGMIEGVHQTDVEVVATYGNKTCTESANKEYEVVILADPIYPDAFSPNGDGLNDIYRPILNPLATIVEMRIYNRWGDIVYNYETNENKDGWDGTHLGQNQNTGLYTYYVKIVQPGNKEFLQEGQVNLIR